MNKKTFIFALAIIFVVLPAAMGAYATYQHSAFKIGDGKDIDLNGQAIGNGSFVNLTMNASTITTGTINTERLPTAIITNQTSSGFMSSHATKASGTDSTAMGYQTTASGLNSFSAGYQSVASGANSVAIGYQATASAEESTALGMQSISDGQYAITLGSGAKASGSNSVAIGRAMYVSGDSSVGIGLNGVNNPITQASTLGISGGNVNITGFGKGIELHNNAGAVYCVNITTSTLIATAGYCN